MTPWGYEEAGMARAEFIPTKGEKNRQSHKATKLKTSASNKRGSNGLPLKRIETRLSEPQYRKVAGHVSRRANTSVAADPPPPPPAPIRATSSNQRREKRRKTDGGGLGDDSDDSDSGDQKPGQGKDSPGATSHRRRPRPQNDPEFSPAGPSSQPFESLEFNRIQLIKGVLKRIDRRYESRTISSISQDMILWNQNSEQAAERKTQLMNCVRVSPENIDCQRLDEELGKYLERSLHQAAIEDITRNVHSVMQMTHRFIRELEKEVIRRCEGVNRGHHIKSPSYNMALFHMESLLVSEPVIGEATDLNIDTWSGAVNIFAEALIDKMMRCAEKVLDNPDYPPMEALSANASGEERARFFILNRKRRGITNAYMEWLCEDVDINSIQECPIELLNGLRAMQRLKTLREGTRQTFIYQREDVYGISSPRVSLVMVHDTQPLRIQRVSPDELSRMGWIRDTHTPSFWRSSLLEVAVAGEKRARKAVFKVDMDGSVLAIQRSDAQWVSWESIRDEK